MAYGQDGHIGISFQDSLGTSNVTSMEFFPFISETITENIESLLSESLATRYEEPDDYEGMHTIAGDVVMEVHPILVGKLCKAWAGQSSEWTEATSVYQHRFVPRSTDWEEEVAALPPFSIEIYRDTGSAYLYYDCMANALSFEISQGAIYKVTLGIIGAQFSWAAKQSASYEPGSFFAWDTCSVSLGGSGVTDVSALTLAFNNNLAGKAFLDGNKYHSRILREGYRSAEISGTMLLVSDTEARIYRARTQQPLIVTCTDPNTVMLDHNRIEIDVPKMLYTAFPTNIGGAGLVEVGFSAKGKYDVDSTYMCQFTVTNTHAVYGS